ncbi:MAG: ketoacyl-ACP synthase III [Nitrospiraceae bacterium]|jgi:3-oxoacyl-[acyl-carrier-protein] synthase-3|uniref:beta-ketoacyl-ACP synthase III n=1 Tax=Nitrospira cf. moscoviensis SBR1015 TaxID=96242 RepID=UPI000A0B012E|nr:beta-ketoacyl-ACP synthase III [Nitrospira cf. moscoviensis SBR1015]MBY0246440.1 ketoacyl-ACP synthase III [Nitrospiraceae bacterium]OQW34989.1 MAG: 3-oxoacyl-ACP synthase [Nitrospira sp. SG-bin2]
MKSRITGTGSYAPAKVLTNADLERMVATSDEWIRERTGIRERHIAAAGEACSDLAVQAGRRALAAAGLPATELDMVLVATCTGDYPLPSTACLVQHQLGATKAAACDIAAACCGFVYALSVADAYVKAGMRHVLVIGSEVMSAITDWTDRNTCVLFGDGAGAAVVSAGDGERGILSTHLRSDGNLNELIAVPGGGSRMPPSEKTIAERMQCIKMKGHETFKVAVRNLEEIARETLAANHLRVEDLDLYVPHQANLRILTAVMERLGLPAEKVMLNLDRYGNTSAASIPIALDEAVRAGRIRDGSLVMLGAFGAGLTWASAMIRW